MILNGLAYLDFCVWNHLTGFQVWPVHFECNLKWLIRFDNSFHLDVQYKIGGNGNTLLAEDSWDMK